MLGPTEPWALWQSEHDTMPSRIGWREGRLIRGRMSLWQAKHTSTWVSLSRTGSLAACSWWQEEQETSLRSCLLPCQWMRVRPWWQVRQTSFFSAEVILLKRRGMGLAGLLTCSAGSPWHIMQPTLTGARLSALVPCLPAQIRWALVWQLAQNLPLLISSGVWARTPAGRHKMTSKARSAARGAATLISIYCFMHLAPGSRCCECFLFFLGLPFGEWSPDSSSLPGADQLDQGPIWDANVPQYSIPFLKGSS